MNQLAAALGVSLLAAAASLAADPANPAGVVPGALAVQTADGYGYQKQSFVFQGLPAAVVVPPVAAPGKPWVWRTSAPTAAVAMDQELLRCGYHLACIEVPEAFAADAALDLLDRFYAQVRTQWGLAERAALDPCGPGGSPAHRYAARRGERLACTFGEVTDGMGKRIPQPSVFDSVRFVMWNTEVLPAGREYFHVRHGLGNCSAKFARDKAGRVAFLGGSITFNPGWRDEVVRYLQQRFPDTKLDVVAAGIPSLGSNAHAFRLEQDVLARGPVDLLFVEAAVNDGTNIPDQPERMLRSMEGLVRHLRVVNPLTDIVELHFAMPEALAAYDAGRAPVPEAQHERVAEHYGCPSLNLTQEVSDRIKAGQFTWASGFGDVHPPPYGQRVYANSIARLLDAGFASAAPPAPHVVPEALLDPFSYSQGRFGTLADAKLGPGFTLESAWRPVRQADTREGFVNVPALTASTAGAEMAYSFHGSAVGLLLAAGPDSCVLEFSIDAGPYARRDTFSPWSAGLYLPWPVMLADTLPPGPHTLTVRTTAQAESRTALHILRILVN